MLGVLGGSFANKSFGVGGDRKGSQAQSRSFRQSGKVEGASVDEETTTSFKHLKSGGTRACG